ncbi:hypothetical protein GCM10008967_37050 [Bacillus carboniphilus]|uniref:Bacterial Ig-like domain-containing protein n=1 Tax=Bacillus carboniphilus TaxID=86663 RepID=A0ABP3GGF4_9BACI
MKRYLCALFCMAISLTILFGCGSKNNSHSAKGTDDFLHEANVDPFPETTDWEPTIYKTVNSLDGVTMFVKDGTISSTGLTVTFENHSNKQCVYGQYFSLEKKINGVWYQVPVALDGDYGFNAIGYDLAPSNMAEWTVDWNWLYGSLDQGEYRIVKDLLDFRNTGDYDEHYLTAEFTIE